MNFDLTPILQAVIMLLATLITYKLIPWIKENTTKKQQENMQLLVKIAVLAAEQIYGAGYGYRKMDYAIDWLAARGITVDRATIEAAIKEYIHPTTEHEPMEDDVETEEENNEDDLK